MLKNPPPQVKGKLVGNHIILDIIEEKSHYWSPHLNFRIEDDEYNEGQTIVAGLIGPKPAVWTMFMFFYFSIGIIGFIISCYGVPRLMLGEYTHTVWAFPISFLVMLTAYKAGKYGEKKGAEQVEILKQFIRDALKLNKKS